MLFDTLTISLLTAMSANVLALPTISSRAAGNQAVDQILAIAPASASCANAKISDDCRTAAQAVQPLIDGFQKYEIYSSAEIAAVLSLVAFESVEFQFNTNQSPGRPGQGTRNMQMAGFNLLYARSIPELKTKLDAITSGTTVADGDSLTDDKKNAVRALVLPDEYSFASAAWFLTTQCADARPAIQKAGDAALAAYMGCVGTTITPERTAYYAKATAALGV